jgi:putative glutamine amidotransferase
MSKPRIAIPLPTSTDSEYNQRSWPIYATAIERAGGEPVEIPLNLPPAEIAKLASSCHGVLLPGSPADTNPQKYGQEAAPSTAPADLPRENVDELLLQDAHNLYKPLLCICYGTQSLNVWRGGTLVQDLTILPVNHKAGRSVATAHSAAIAPDSLLGTLVMKAEAPEQDGFLRLPVNSSHHQAIGIPGDGLRVTARCPQDGVIEAVEGGQSPESGNSHFVLGVQWHPERSYEISPASQAIFARFIQEASAWTPRAIHTSIG